MSTPRICPMSDTVGCGCTAGSCLRHSRAVPLLRRGVFDGVRMLQISLCVDISGARCAEHLDACLGRRFEWRRHRGIQQEKRRFGWGTRPAQSGEVKWQTVERMQAAYLAKYPSGDALGEFRGAGRLRFMCNLYSHTKGQQAIRELVKYTRDMTGNLPSQPAIFPNRTAPVVRVAPDGVRELVMMRWGFPPPVIPGSKPRNPTLTNVRNTDSRYWRTYLKNPVNRCLVPVTSFAEP